MSKNLLWTLPVMLLAFHSEAAASEVDCEARAARVVEQLEGEAASRLSPSEADLAWKAALASCENEASTGPDAAAVEGSRLERFVAGLFSMEPTPARTRLGRKYHYLEKD